MGLQGNDEDVRFDWAAAERLQGSLERLAGVLDSQAGARASWVAAASEEFRGRYAEAFRRNATTASRDSAEFADALRDAKAKLAELAMLAREEQSNREQAREWHREQEDRNAGEKFVDWVSGGEKPPEPARTSPTLVATMPAASPRGH